MTIHREAPSSRAELAEYYAGLLAEQESSGLSVAEFADEVGISSATLYSWRRRLEGAPRTRHLVEVKIADDHTEGDSMLVLRVDDRFAIEVPANFDRDALSHLLEILGEC